jgi:glutamine amidotransferase
MIAVVDYGMGNLRSAQKGLERAGAEAVVTDDPATIANADAVVLPGVGAFGDCYRGLEKLGLVPVVHEAIESGKPFLGICIGLQLLFTESEEGGKCGGLDAVAGQVVRFRPEAGSGLKVPHMGWNEVVPAAGVDCPLFRGVQPGSYFYFVHSYYAMPADPAVTAATTPYCVDFTSVVWRDNLYAVQFHPEKSQRAGLKVLDNFVSLVG